MEPAKSKRWKLLGASALAFLLATAASFLLLTSNSDANAKSKKTQTTLMAKQQTPEPSPTPQKKKNAKEQTAPTEPTPTSNSAPPRPRSLEERLKEDLQKAREACKQKRDVEAFRTACSVANTIRRNKLDQSGANAETYKNYCQEAVEIAQTSGERLQQKNNDHDKPLVFIF